VPFLSAGVGAFTQEIGRPLGALSLGGGLKIPLSRRVALRVGAQHRIPFESGRAQRLDLYGGIFVRF